MKIIDRHHPAHLLIKERRRLNRPESTKETFHISLDIKNSGIQFRVGDAIGVYAENDPNLVAHLLQALKLTGKEAIRDPRGEEMITTHTFFSTKANLSRLTSSFLKLLYEHEKEHDRKNQLGHLLDQNNRQVLLEYLAKHDPLDLFKEYRDVNIPLQELCAQFGPLLPRFYSIASSLHALPSQLDLVVVVSTFTHSGERRFGVASHFLSHLAIPLETKVPVYVQPNAHFTLPADPNTPILMIGPGTGVAPFRAFLQERLAKGAKGKNWLFFGERNKNHDFFYEEEWEKLTDAGHLRLSLAFSRDQDQKCYVQHRLYEAAKDVWAWIQEGAILYISGDAQHMAKDVTAMLELIVSEQGHLSPEDAKAFIRTLKAEKRFLLDVY